MVHTLASTLKFHNKEHLSQDGSDIQRLGWETSICFIGLQNFYSCIDWGNLLLFDLW